MPAAVPEQGSSHVDAVRFGRFTLEPLQRRLLDGGQPVALGARAFDLLGALVQRAGQLVTKQELLTLVWPGLVVEENNLQVQVSSLRKLLGPAALATVPGRGYRFELPVERIRAGGAPVAVDVPVVPIGPVAQPTRVPQPRHDAVDTTAAAAPKVPTNLPPQRPLLYGRATDVGALRARVTRHPIVCIAGAGGIGKTRVAQAVAAAVAQEEATTLPDGVWWIELASVADAALVAATVARALGEQLGGGASPEAELKALVASKRCLLVLDNCEHLVDAVAQLVESLRAFAPGVRVLVTSQEPLRLAEEHVYRLGTLGVKGTGGDLAGDEFGALQLFVARAEAADPRFALTEQNRSAVLEICGRLDGIPLAIELAAARLPLLGIEGLRSRLDERFGLLTAGSRVVLRRHQTLRATFDWSHSLLSPEQQTVFRRIGVFAGTFSLRSVQEVVADDTLDRWAVLDHLGVVVDKSLVLAEGEGEPRYRLLETARAYALERLADSGETHAIMRRHAEALLRTMAQMCAADDETSPSAHDLAEAGLELDNLRAALAMAATGDDALAVGLVAYSWRVWCGSWQTSEGFERGLALRRCLHSSLPPELVARFWLTVCTLGLYSNRRDAYEAARKAVDCFRASGNDRLLFDALIKAGVMGVRFSTLEEMEATVAEAERLVSENASTLQRTRLEFVRFRLLTRQGRFEEALAAAQRQSAIARQGGNELGALYAVSNIVAAEIQLGRFEEALAHARDAVTALEALGSGGGAGHCWLGIASAHAMLGHAADALAACRTAYELLRSEGDQRRVLVLVAISAALDGRVADAARAVGYGHAADARGGVIQELSWTRVRGVLESLLAEGLSADERARLMAEGATMEEGEVVRRGLGDG